MITLYAGEHYAEVRIANYHTNIVLVEADGRVLEERPVEECLGRVCAAPAVSCPPAVPILVCGEVVDQAAVERFRYHGIDRCAVVK